MCYTRIETDPKAPCEIQADMFCTSCVQELPGGTTIEEYSDLAVGLTPRGIQLWCRRHNSNVVIFDVGQPANTPSWGYIPQLHSTN